MIEIEGKRIRIKELRKLLKGNPVDAIFESLDIIWKHEGPDLAQYYRVGEDLTMGFERQIWNLYPEIYEVIIHNSERSDVIGDILSREQFCLIIMDGMSLREAPLILNEVKNFNVSYTYSYSSLPSETEFFTKKYFGAKSPSEIRTPDNCAYFHLQREDRIEDVPLDSDRLIVWSTHPDQIFSSFRTGFETQDLEKIGMKCRDMLSGLMRHLMHHEEIVITSDHGYLVDTYSWKGLVGFPSSERYAPMVPEYLKRFCRFANDYWIIAGRYNTIKRGKYVHVRHGGLSFLETIVPLIEITKKGGKKHVLY